MNVRRLEKLAAHLESVPRRGFDMMSWVLKDGYGLMEPDAFAKLRKAAKNEYKCGMAACVGGHAAIVFPKTLTITHGQLDLVSRRTYPTNAFAEAFELCLVHSSDITDADAPHQTPKAAARAIRKLIKENPPCCSGRLR